MDYRILVHSKLEEFYENLPEVSHSQIWLLVLRVCFPLETCFEKKSLLSLDDQSVYTALCKVYIRELNIKKEDSELSPEELEDWINKVTEK